MSPALQVRICTYIGIFIHDTELHNVCGIWDVHTIHMYVHRLDINYYSSLQTMTNFLWTTWGVGVEDGMCRNCNVRQLH